MIVYHIYNPIELLFLSLYFTELHIDGAAGSGYRITDVAGRELAHGTISGANTIDVRQLAAGTYLLYVDGEAGKPQITKFTRN